MNNPEESLVIRHAGKNDVMALEKFYSEHFSDKPILADMNVWQWTFAQNPNQFSGTPFLVIEEGGEIKGGIGFLSVFFHIDGEIKKGFHPVNYFVLDEYKGLPALRLLRSVISENEVGYVSSFTPEAAKLFKTSRWVDVSHHVKNYYLPLRMKSTDNNSMISIAKDVVKRVIRGVLLNIFTVISLLGRLYGTKVRISPQLDEECVKQIDHMKNAGQGVVRDYPFLHWRYEQSPRLNVVYFYTYKKGVCKALAVVHIDAKNKTAVILDVVLGSTVTDFELLCMITSVIRYCRKHGLVGLSATFLNRRIDKILRRIGFGVYPCDFGLMAYARNKTQRQLLAEPELWDFWIGHSDIY